MKDLLQWHPEKRAVKDLKGWSKNPRKISKENLERLKERIRQRGFHDVLKVDTEGYVLSGNQRRKCLLELGIEEVTVLVPSRNLTEEEKNKIALESNTNDGDWDLDLLKEFDVDLLKDVGFDSELLSNIWDDNLEIKDDDFDEKRELAKIKNPKTKLDDIIQLGEHRLICGDSNNSGTLKKLFGNQRASVLYSDPIYNIDLDYNKGLGGKQNYGGNVIDKRTDEEYLDFLRKNISSALTVANPDCHIFYWNTERQIWMLQTLYRELGVSNKRVCIWVKNGHNCTPGVAFNKCYEPCIYGTIGSPYLSKKEQGLTEIMNKEIGTGNESLDDINIWTAKRVSSKDLSHATTKPVDLHEKAIRRCTKPGDIILDSFGGSGSTLITAEQLKRKSYLVELEPVFCDLIIRRYEKMTGKKAVYLKGDEKE
jgi:site-specific DNA-methyltransferase (adenine-specific)